MNEELLVEVLKQCRKKFSNMNEIFRLTRELGDALSRNDKVSVQMLLGMRGEEMAAADSSERNIRLMLEQTGIQDTDRLECLLSESSGENTENCQKLINQIRDINLKTKNILRDTIAVDKQVSRKLAGDESYYGGRV